MRIRVTTMITAGLCVLAFAIAPVAAQAAPADPSSGTSESKPADGGGDRDWEIGEEMC